jgi:hypothetical protein
MRSRAEAGWVFILGRLIRIKESRDEREF